MTTDPGPHHIESTRAVFKPDGSLQLLPVTPTFYRDLDATFTSFAGHILVSRFTFAEPWPTWEMHPAGDELVYLLEGETDFLLWKDGHQTTVHVGGSDGYLMVPKGTWHTARPRTITSMLFLTPGEGTLNAENPG
jgi:mannose-6-phosphate isomerase-like protein (cupin superfamily)